MPDEKKIEVVVVGGTFDPPHEGHIDVIRNLLDEQGYRLVVIAPTTQNPFKGRQATALEHRIRMVKTLLHAYGIKVTRDPGGSGVYVSDFKYERTYQFVDYWRSGFDSEIAWSVGPELVDEVKTWAQWDRLNLPIVVVPERVAMHATLIREGKVPPHTSLAPIIRELNLYQAPEEP